MPFLIEQQSSGGRRVELDGRALPYASSVEWGGEQRTDVTYLPGSPDAVAQLYGPKQLPMSPEGRWGDRYMQGDSASCLVKVDGRQITSALEAAQILDRIREEGILLRVAYEQEVRYGLLIEWRYRPFAEGRTLERIDWSAKFEWLSRGNKMLTPAVPNRVGAQNFAAKMAIYSAQVETAWLNLLGKSDALMEAAAIPVAKIRGIADTAQQAASALTQRAADAVGIAQSVTGLASEVTAAAFALNAAVTSTAVSSAVSIQTAADRFATLGAALTDPGIGAAIVLARDQQAVLTLSRQLADLSDQITAAAEKALADVQPFVVYAMRGETLRDIALRELGSIGAWRDIALLNGLPGSEVAPGTPILIPVQKQPNTPS